MEQAHYLFQNRNGSKTQRSFRWPPGTHQILVSLPLSHALLCSFELTRRSFVRQDSVLYGQGDLPSSRPVFSSGTKHETQASSEYQTLMKELCCTDVGNSALQEIAAFFKEDYERCVLTPQMRAGCLGTRPSPDASLSQAISHCRCLPLNCQVSVSNQRLEADRGHMQHRRVRGASGLTTETTETTEGGACPRIPFGRRSVG